MAGSPSEPIGGYERKWTWASPLGVPEAQRASRARSGECWGRGQAGGGMLPNAQPGPWRPMSSAGSRSSQLGGSAHWGASAMAFSTRRYQGWMRV